MSFLPLVEQLDQYVLANHSRFPSIADEEFLSGTHVVIAVTKVGSFYLNKEFRREARQFLEEYTNSMLSNVAARSHIGQRLSCFCHTIVIGGDDHAPVHLFGLLLDGLREKGWVGGSDVEAWRAEYQSLSKENDN